MYMIIYFISDLLAVVQCWNKTFSFKGLLCNIGNYEFSIALPLHIKMIFESTFSERLAMQKLHCLYSAQPLKMISYSVWHLHGNLESSSSHLGSFFIFLKVLLSLAELSQVQGSNFFGFSDLGLVGFDFLLELGS